MKPWMRVVGIVLVMVLPIVIAGVVFVTSLKPAKTSGAAGVSSSDGFTDLGPGEAAESVKAPAPGSYKYAIDADGTKSDLTLIVATKGTDAGGGAEVTEERKGARSDTTTTMVFGSDDVEISGLTLSLGGGASSGTCTYDKPLTDLALPLAAGKSWQSAASCSMSAFSRPTTISRKVAAKVVGARRVRVAGAVTNAWLVTSTEEETAATNTSRTTVKRYFDPARGLYVRTETVRSSGQGAATVIQTLTH